LLSPRTTTDYVDTAIPTSPIWGTNATIPAKPKGRRHGDKPAPDRSRCRSLFRGPSTFRLWQIALKTCKRSWRDLGALKQSAAELRHADFVRGFSRKKPRMDHNPVRDFCLPRKSALRSPRGAAPRPSLLGALSHKVQFSGRRKGLSRPTLSTQILSAVGRPDRQCCSQPLDQRSWPCRSMARVIRRILRRPPPNPHKAFRVK